MSGVADIATITQVGSDGGGHFDGERQSEVGGQVALVDLVEDHGADTGEFGVVLQPPGQHAFGDHFDPRSPALM